MSVVDLTQLGALLLGVWSAGFGVGLLMSYYRRFIEHL
jgi:hypothetical protein